MLLSLLVPPPTTYSHPHSTAALERCAGEVVTDILQIVETYDPDEAQMQLVMRGESLICSQIWQQ